MRMSPPTHRYVPKGRRPSVATTMERRLPSARRRPGAGFLPARPSVARVAARTARPEPFQVFSEEEFFSLEACGGESVAGDALGLSVDSGGTRRTGVGAVLGIATLGVALSLVLAIVLTAIVPARGGKRKASLRAARMQRGADQSRRFAGRHLDRLPRARARSPHTARRVAERALETGRPRSSTGDAAREAERTVAAVRPSETQPSQVGPAPGNSPAAVSMRGDTTDTSSRTEFGFER